MERGAVLSDNGLYRYELTRRWDDGQSVLWVMLNPSTADADIDDPTIRRCVNFTKSWGYGGIKVVNLYAFRATDPGHLRDAFEAGIDPVGPDNAETLRGALAAYTTAFVVAAWGTKADPHRVAGLATMAIRARRQLRALGITKDGHPRHPLYVKGDAELIVWRES